MWLEGVVGKPGTEEDERVLKRLNRALRAYSGLGFFFCCLFFVFK